MKISPTSLKIEQVFSTSNERFYVPAYQRRYSWGFEQLSNLFDDIDTLKDDESHLLGSIVCLTAGHRPGINILEVVDGQQRLTTISILLIALKEKFQKADNIEISEEIEKYLHCRNIEREKENKILLGDLDNPDYKNLIKGNFSKIINENLTNAFEYFSEWLEEFDTTRLNRFYFKLMNNTSLIRLDVTDARDAYKLFETINNRGLKLSHTDIIKNFLLGHASTINPETLEEVRENWKNLIVNLDGINIDSFFRQLMVNRTKQKISSSKTIYFFRKEYIESVKEAVNLSDYYLFNESDVSNDDNDTEESIKSSAKKQSRVKVKSSDGKTDIIAFSNELNQISSLYGKVINRTFPNKYINKHLFNLERIRSVPSYILLIDILNRDIEEKEIIKMLKVIETFMLRRHICAKRTSELDDIFAKIVGFSAKKPEEELKELLLKDLPSDKEFQEMIETHDFSRQHDRAKYILEEIEYYLIDDKNEYTINSGTDVHLEHIVPQTIKTKKSQREFGDWTSYLGDRSLELHGKYVNRLGNFTLLSGELNIIASNNPFSSKIEEYKKSNFSLTQEICNNYKKFKFQDIENRSKELAKLAPKIWKF